MPVQLFGINVRVQKLLFPEENGGGSLLKKQLPAIGGDVAHCNLAMSPNIGDMTVNVFTIS